MSQSTTNMDIVKFAEKICGTKLCEWQKELLRMIQDNPDKKFYVRMTPKQGRIWYDEMYREYLKMKGDSNENSC